MKPVKTPANPCFSSGPTSKRPGWSAGALSSASLGRSHRAKGPKARIQKVIDESRSILGIPDDYVLGLVPGSDTGAFELAMWSLLGERGVDVCCWESFGQGWLSDIRNQLKLSDVRVFEADYGALPDLNQTAADRDIVFTWNGTTSGVKVPNADWIAADRSGLTLCDATSAAFAMELDWQKLDVVTWSWQKVLGGEAGQGMLALSPRAVARLENYTPSWPLPKVFRLTKSGKLISGIFAAATINTPSMLAVEDQLDSLQWAQDLGGLPALIERSQANLAVVRDWVQESDWADFLAVQPEQCSSTSICLKITDSWFTEKDDQEQKSIIKAMVASLDSEGAAFDVGGYRDAPAGIRIWGGATVDASDVAILMPWLDWAYAAQKGG
jgi:phosphoserine aminotransferase